MIHYSRRLASAIAASTLLCGVSQAQQHQSIHSTSPAESRRPADRRLVGSWEPAGGKAIVYLPDGTGKNPDGSRFTWRLDGDYLVAQALSKDGKPSGGRARIPILFTRDGREHATFLEAGHRKTPFYRLLPDGRIDKHKSRAGAAYLSHKFAPQKRDDDDGPPPTIIKPAPGKPSGTDNPKAAPPGPSLSQGGSKRRGTGDRYIHVGPNIQVSAALRQAPHNEVTIAAQPLNPDGLLAASMLEAPGHPNVAKIAVYASFDGGKTWDLSLQRNNPNPQNYADPAFGCGADGTVYFADMYFPTAEMAPPDRGACVEFTHTSDGGKSWVATTLLEGWHDRPFLAVDTTSGPRKGWLYCSVGYPDRRVFVCRGWGGTFLPMAPFSQVTGEQILSGNPVVASDGSLLYLYMSVPGKRIATFDPDARQAGAGREAAQVGAVRIARSVDGGISFSPTQKIADFRSSGVKPGGLPMLAADPGSPVYGDHVYAVWADMQAGGTCVRLAVSKDKGVTWSRPILLSEQNDKQSYEAFLPSVAVNKAGVVGVSWYDTRRIPLDQAGWDVRFCVSRDGGDTWQPSVRVTDVSTLNQKKRRNRPHPETRFNNIQPGHTAGIAADTMGRFHPLWIDGRTGVRQVFTASIIVDDLHLRKLSLLHSILAEEPNISAASR